MTQPEAFIVNIASISDTANQAQITVALDLDGYVQMRLIDSACFACTELTRAEAHQLAHALHDAVFWPDVL